MQPFLNFIIQIFGSLILGASLGIIAMFLLCLGEPSDSGCGYGFILTWPVSTIIVFWAFLKWHILPMKTRSAVWVILLGMLVVSLILQKLPTPDIIFTLGIIWLVLMALRSYLQKNSAIYLGLSITLLLFGILAALHIAGQLLGFVIIP